MKKSIDLILYLDNKEIKIQEDILNKSIQKLIKNACTNEKIDFNDYLFFNINDVININNDSLLLKDIIKENDELNTNTLKIISFPKNKKIINEDCIIHSTNKPDEIRSIICPQCQQYIIMEINDYKIFLSKCKNGHQFNNIYLKNFYSTQKYEKIKSILKEIQEDNIINEPKEEDVAPPTPLSSKDIENNEIKEQNDNNEKYSYNTKCHKHKMQQFSSYCLNCKKNLCSECEMNHNIFRKNNELHKIVHFYEILSNNDEYLEKLRNDLEKFRHKLDILKIDLSKLSNIINSVINNFEINYNIYYDLISNYLIEERNYHILKNIKNIKFSEIFKDLDNINNEGHFHKKFEKTFEVYNKMSCQNEITIKYFPDKEKKIRILGQNFLNNNRTKCKFLINNNTYELFDLLKITKDLEKLISANNGIFEVKLCINQGEYLTNMSHMFHDCSSILYLPDISELNTFHVTDMSYLFYGCNLLENIPNISKWNLSNVENLGYMFFNCSNLISLPDISNWDISNVKDLSHLFSNCASLEKLPNSLSCWNTKNVENLSYLFYYCVSLKELPDISKWNISKVNNISYMFSCCNSLTKLPDISVWNTEKVNNIEYLFYGCKSLNSLPDLSKWNTKNVTNMGFAFDELNSKVQIPKINPSECTII